MVVLNLCEYLVSLAEKYEVSDFSNGDPSKFTKYYKNQIDCEVSSFTAAMLSFGNRTQFIKKIETIFELAGNSFSEWLLSHKFIADFDSLTKNPDEKFYRFYSFRDMTDLFSELSEILKTHKSLGECLKKKWIDSGEKYLDLTLSNCFPKSRIVSKGKNSANKRINMFLRWMVRKNSPVDLGLWSWFDAKNLIIPLDVHVLKESVKLGLLDENAKADRKTAILLTEKMKEIFPEDPCRADFALFGIGVDK